MKRLVILLGLTLLLLAGGCLELKQKLVLNADGSGELQIAYQLSPEALTLLKGEGRLPGPLAGFDPKLLPVTGDGIEKLAARAGLQATDIALEKRADGGLAVSYKLAFKDVHQFAAGMDGIFQLRVTKLEPEGENGVEVQLRGLGMNMAGHRLMQARRQNRLKQELAIARLALHGFRYTLEARMPGEIKRKDPAAADAGNNTVIWNWNERKIREGAMLDEQQRLVMPHLVIEATALEFDLPVTGQATRSFRIPGPEELTLKLAEMRLSHQSSFRRDRQRAQRVLSVEAAAAPPPDCLLVARQNATVSEAQTFAGEQLATPDRQRGRRRRNPWQPIPPRDRGQVRIPLPMRSPRQNVAGLRSLKGSVKLIFAGELRRVEAKDLEAWNGRQLEIEELGDLKVRIILGDDVLRVTPDTQQRHRLRSVHLETPLGRMLPPPPRPGNRGRGWEFRYKDKPPKDAVLVLRFYDKLQEIELPFAFTDLKFPAPKAKP